jgi:hypothetical protein
VQPSRCRKQEQLLHGVGTQRSVGLKQLGQFLQGTSEHSKNLRGTKHTVQALPPCMVMI